MDQPPTADRPPLTERVLARLGRPRLLSVVLWSLVPLGSQLAFTTGVGVSGEPLPEIEFQDLFATQLGLVFATFVLLNATGMLARRATDLEPAMDRLAGGAPDRRWFDRLGSTIAPLLLTAVVAALVSASACSRTGRSRRSWPSGSCSSTSCRS